MKILLSFFIVFLFIGCSDKNDTTYTYTPADIIIEEECVPQLVGGDSNSSDTNDDDDAGDGGATDDPAMPDNGRDDDDEEEDDQAKNTAPIAYQQYGNVNVTVDCLIYPLITAVSAQRLASIIPPTSTLMRMQTRTMPSPYIGQYKIEMGAYAIREERIYLGEGFFVFAFIMPDNETTGKYRLISPPNKSGMMEVTFVEDRTTELKMEGKMINAEIYTNEDQNETYTLSLDFSTTILDTRYPQ